MIAICSLHKNTNPYVNEWVAWHLSIGFDRIFIYDDNDPSDPYVGDYIDAAYRDKVTITQFRDEIGLGCIYKQTDNINAFIRNHADDVEWCAFIDSDEFVHIDRDMHEWLDNAPKDVCCVGLNWKMYGDDGIIEGDETKPVQQRFVECIDDRLYDKFYFSMCKKIIRLDKDITAYDMFVFKRGAERLPMHNYKFEYIGECSPVLPPESIDYDYRLYHYITKSLSECIKYKCSDLWGIESLKKYFFMFNDWNIEKENYFANHFKQQ